MSFKSQPTPLLDRVTTPADLRYFNLQELEHLAKELRQEVIEIVAKNGGFLGASLGVIELTIALHYVFNTPDDLIIWDVGHQSCPHKILTERRRKMRLMGRQGGPSYYPKRSESIYDPLDSTHGGTALSTALGLAVARDLENKDHQVISIVGDNAICSGIAFEAFNNAGIMPNKLLIILNDQYQHIIEGMGAIGTYLKHILSRGPYHSLRQFAKDRTERFSNASNNSQDQRIGPNFRENAFEQFGFYYIGPIDGHNLEHLIKVLKSMRKRVESGPVLLHIATQNGRGYSPAEAARDNFSTVRRFDPSTGIQELPEPPTYQKICIENITNEAEDDKKIVVISTDLPKGKELDAFANKYPERFFNVAIAEQHAVAFAASLASQGMKPFVIIGSPFLQRALDQVITDVANQRLPVRFIVNRAGFVGAEGVEYSGLYDIAFMSNLSHMVVMAPADVEDLHRMTATAIQLQDRPCMIRYPSHSANGNHTSCKTYKPLPLGKGRIIQQGSSVALLSFGMRLCECIQAADTLKKHGHTITIADARFSNPLDETLIIKLSKEHKFILTIEEGASGGFSAQVLMFLANHGLLDEGLKIRSLVISKKGVKPAPMESQYQIAGLTSQNIVKTILGLISQNTTE